VSSQSQKTHLKWPLRLTHSQSDGIQLILDLGGVDYVSSSGLMVLCAAARSLSADCGALVLCHVSEPVRIAIQLAGLLDTLAIESSREKAARRAKSLTAGPVSADGSPSAR
jgi:anti-anti-sigma factor